MSDPAFAAAVALILEAEGVFSDDKQDPGGETYYGIARASHPDIPWPPSKSDAIAIYFADYWSAHRCGEMPWPWALAIFDGAVNQGGWTVNRAELALQLANDGKIGPACLAAMRSRNADDAYRSFIALRAEAYMKSSNFATFGHGWLRRLVKIVQAGEHAPS